MGHSSSVSLGDVSAERLYFWGPGFASRATYPFSMVRIGGVLVLFGRGRWMTGEREMNSKKRVGVFKVRTVTALSTHSVPAELITESQVV